MLYFIFRTPQKDDLPKPDIRILMSGLAKRTYFIKAYNLKLRVQASGLRFRIRALGLKFRVRACGLRFEVRGSSF